MRRERLSGAEDVIVAASKGVKVGAPDEPDVTVRPLVSATERDKVVGYTQPL